MSSFAQIHSAALARALQHAGAAYVFGGVEFLGVLGKPKPDDPRLQGASDRCQVLTVSAAELARKFPAAPRPARGATITRAGDSALFLVSRGDLMADGSFQFLVTES